MFKPLNQIKLPLFKRLKRSIYGRKVLVPVSVKSAGEIVQNNFMLLDH